MNDSEFDDIMELGAALWPGARSFPVGNDLTPLQLRILSTWKDWLGEYPEPLVRGKLRMLSDRLDRAPSWPKLRETLGSPPREKTVQIHCNVCQGDGLAKIILDRRGGASPETVYTGSVPCICTRRTPPRFRHQIEERFDRAQNLDISYHLMWSQDVDRLQAERRKAAKEDTR